MITNRTPISLPSALLIEPHYLPTITYLQHVYHTPRTTLEIHHQYQKQTYQNRCYILTSQGLQKLIIPIQHNSIHTTYKNVKVDYSTPWIAQHIKAIATAYSQTPYYTTLADLIHPILLKKPTYLLEVNKAILTAILKFLQLKKEITTTNTYEPIPPSNICDFRHKLHPKKTIPFTPIPTYPQRFSATASPQLSILDLLCSQGPDTLTLLEKPTSLNN